MEDNIHVSFSCWISSLTQSLLYGVRLSCTLYPPANTTYMSYPQPAYAPILYVLFSGVAIYSLMSQ